MQLHAGFEATHLCHVRGLAGGLTRRAACGNHGRMPMMLVHAQLAFVVCAPKTKGHKPSVQQTGVIWVFDIFLHQLPVTWNTLPVVAQNFELSPIEHAIKVLKDGGSHKIF